MAREVGVTMEEEDKRPAGGPIGKKGVARSRKRGIAY